MDNFMDGLTALLLTDFESPMLFPRYLINTLMITVLVVIFQLWLATPAAYLLAKVKFSGAKVLNCAVEIGLLFGGSALFVNQYAVLNKLQLINTFSALILPAAVSSLAVVLMRQFIMQIPDEVIDAARLDGAGHLRICSDIIIPNIKPARITAGIFAITSAWQTGVYNFVYSEELKTTAVVMERLRLADNPVNAGIVCALAVIMMFIPLAAFLIYRKSVIKTMAYGGLK
jgi:ABC-type glycerol-3-phosphate transport system permease component